MELFFENRSKKNITFVKEVVDMTIGKIWQEVVDMTIGNPAFSLLLYLTGVHFRGELLYGGDVIQQKIKCRPIRAREIGGASFSDVLYGKFF